MNVRHFGALVALATAIAGCAGSRTLVAQPEMAEADVLITPAIGVLSLSAKEDQERAIHAGYEAARAAPFRIPNF